VSLLENNIERLERICKNIAGNDWRDLFQDLAVKILEADQEKIEEKFFSWCYMVAKNKHLDNLNENKRFLELQNDSMVYDHRLNVFERVNDLKRHLNGIEKMWVDVYLDNDCKFVNIQKQTRISRQHASERIKAIIEKCKRLK